MQYKAIFGKDTGLLEPGVQEELNKRFMSESEALKNAMFTGWYNRIEASVSSIGSFRSIRKSLTTMLEYTQVFGMIPYEFIPAQKIARRKGSVDRKWMEPKRKIPDPYNIVMVRNRRDNSYTCWNFKTNKEVLVAFDKYEVPFDTKLRQILKAEYTFAELFKKQNGAHLSNGYVLVEEKEKEEGSDQSAALTEQEELDQKARDREEEDLWKSQLRGFDDNVNYYESGPGGKPARVVLQGIARPHRLPYTNKGFKDPTDNLIGSLTKQISSGERSVDDVSKLLRNITNEEDKNLKGAAKKLKELVSSRHDFVSKINKNLNSVSKEIDNITNNESAQSHDSFGIIPIRKMISSMSSSFNSVQDIVTKLEGSMSAVGINPAAETETDMFREMDTRINVASSTAIQRAQLELRTVLTTVEKMLEQMENLVTNHTSSLNPPTVAHERVGMNDVAFDMDYFDNDFAGIIRGGGEVTPTDTISTGVSGDTRSDELYAEYYSKMKEANSMFRTLKNNYDTLVKKFQAFQVKTLQDISNNAKYKVQSADARKLTMVYKTILDTQLKLNREGMTKIETVLRNLEEKISKMEAAKQKKQDETKTKLDSVKNDLQGVLALVDVESANTLEVSVLKSDAVLDKLRRDRTAELTQLSELYRKNIEELRSILPHMEKRMDSKRNELRATIEDQPSTSSSGSDQNTKRAEKVYNQYGTALEQYYDLVDEVKDQREKEIQRARAQEVDRKYKADKARVERESAIKERNHLQAMKRYGLILKGRDEAKRRKMCNGTHTAEAMTVRGINPAPQMMVVKDHFRKAKILPSIPERHMKDMRAFIKERWRDFVDNIFPSLTIVDIHGVKTWTMNFDSILTNIISPFLKVRYGLSPAVTMTGPAIGSVSSMADLKPIFFNLCNEFVSDRLLNAETDEYKHLMFVFKPDWSQEVSRTSITDNRYGQR